MPTDPKAIDMPTESQLRVRVQSVIGDEYTVQNFFPHLVKNLNPQLNGMGVVLGVSLAIHDYTQSLPPMFGRLMQVYFKPLVVALIDDEQVKADALECIQQIESEQGRVQQERLAAPERPELSDERKLLLINQAKRIASIFDEYVKDGQNYSEGHRIGGANPFYNQTLDGLYLAFYYSTPNKIWTPWGAWHFASVQSYDMDLDGFMSRLTLREHTPGKNMEWGYQGPVYAILAVDEVELPEPVLPTDKRQYLSYEDANAEWEELFEAR
jgi:hypothetical protein